MYSSIEQFFEDAKPFIHTFDAWAKEKVPLAAADHLCFKCGSTEEFEEMRRFFETNSIFVYQSIISSRRIAIVKFLQPIQTELGEIWYLELSDQKPDGSQKSGFDHIEIYPTAGSVENLVSDLEQKGIQFQKVVRPHHATFDATLENGFLVRLEPEALVIKIKRDEMQ